MKNYSRSQKWNFWSLSVLHWDKRSHEQKIAPKYPQMTLKHLSWAYYKNISYFLAFWGHFGTFRSCFGPVLGLNLKLSQTSHVTTQNNRKRSRIPMELVSEVNLKMLMSFWDHLGLFVVIFGSGQMWDCTFLWCHALQALKLLAVVLSGHMTILPLF